MQNEEQRAEDVADEVGTLAGRHRLDVAVAESLTGGKIANQLAAAEGSGEWFVGALVAYQTRVKHQVLHVPDGPVISEQSVVTMAEEVASLLQANASVAASGAGGPGRQEGQEPGTTWIAVKVHDTVHTKQYHFAGEPIEILGQTQFHALALLRSTIQSVFETSSNTSAASGR